LFLRWFLEPWRLRQKSCLECRILIVWGWQVKMSGKNITLFLLLVLQYLPDVCWECALSRQFFEERICVNKMILAETLIFVFIILSVVVTTSVVVMGSGLILTATAAIIDSIVVILASSVLFVCVMAVDSALAVGLAGGFSILTALSLALLHFFVTGMEQRRMLRSIVVVIDIINISGLVVMLVLEFV